MKNKSRFLFTLSGIVCPIVGIILEESALKRHNDVLMCFSLLLLFWGLIVAIIRILEYICWKTGIKEVNSNGISLDIEVIETAIKSSPLLETFFKEGIGKENSQLSIAENAQVLELPSLKELKWSIFYSTFSSFYDSLEHLALLYVYKMSYNSEKPIVLNSEGYLLSRINPLSDSYQKLITKYPWLISL